MDPWTRATVRTRITVIQAAERKKDGWNGKRTGNTGHQRLLAVTNGHSKAASDLASHALTRSIGIERMTVRFPPAPLLSDNARLTWAFTPGYEGGGFPCAVGQVPDQGNSAEMDGGIRGCHSPQHQIQSYESPGQDQAVPVEGGKWADADTQTLLPSVTGWPCRVPPCIAGSPGAGHDGWSSRRHATVRIMPARRHRSDRKDPRDAAG